MNLLLAFIFGGLAVLITSKVVPGFEVRGGFKTVLIVAGVYGLLKFLFAGVLTFVSLPFVLLTLGLFIIVINAFLLWVTDKILEDFEIHSIGALLLGTVCLSLIDFGAHLLTKSGTIL